MIQTIYLLIIGISTFLGLRNLKFLIPAVFVINIVTDSIILLSEDFIINPGYIRLFTLLLLIISVFSKIVKDKTFLLIIITIVYFLIIGLVNSSNFIVSIEGIAKLFIPFIFYPITLKLNESINFTSERILVKTLNYIVIYVTILFLVFQYFQIGESPYIDGFFYLGGFNIQITYFLAYTIIMLIYFFKTQKKNSKLHRVFKLIIIACAIISIIFIFRRTAILSVLFSISSLFFIYKKNILYFIFIGLFFIFYSNFFTVKNNIFDEIIEKRSRNELVDEGRYMEFFTIYKDLAYHGFPNFLLGNQLFNSKEYFEKESIFQLNNQSQLHTDAGAILHGSGVFGFLLYLIVLFSILKKVYKSASKRDYIFPLLPILLSFVLFSISGQYYIITALSSFFIFLGFISSDNKTITVYKRHLS